MAIVVTSVTKGGFFFVIMVTNVKSVSVIGMVARTHPKCLGLHTISNLFALSNLSY